MDVVNYSDQVDVTNQRPAHWRASTILAYIGISFDVSGMVMLIMTSHLTYHDSMLQAAGLSLILLFIGFVLSVISLVVNASGSEKLISNLILGVVGITMSSTWVLFMLLTAMFSESFQ